MATPHVAGAAALLMSVNPALKGHPDQVGDLLRSTAVTAGVTDPSNSGCGGLTMADHPNYQVGWGRIDVLAAAQAFHDQRLLHQPGPDEFERLEAIGEQAVRVFDQPDAGMWELRTRARVHTSSALMGWAACDRLAKIAQRLQGSDRAQKWSARATAMRERILREAWC